MTATTQDADGSTELIINDSASDVAEIEGKRIYNAVDCNVTVMEPNFANNCEIVVYWNNDSPVDVGGHQKASIINKVLESDASVTLKSTDDGNRAVSFRVNELN